MPKRGNIDSDQIKRTSEHGDQYWIQKSDNTGAEGNVAVFNADGSLTDGGPLGGTGGTGTHTEILTDGAGVAILANGDFIYVLGVSN